MKRNCYCFSKEFSSPFILQFPMLISLWEDCDFLGVTGGQKERKATSNVLLCHFKKKKSYEFCQAREDPHSPVKLLLPFWGNCNNKSWNVLNCLSLFPAETYVRASVIAPDWGYCNCFDFSVNIKWRRILPNLYYAKDFFSTCISSNSMLYMCITC